MRKIAEQLAQIANQLDEAGRTDLADAVEGVMNRLVEDSLTAEANDPTGTTAERKFDIDVVYDISVAKADFAKYDEPPAATHRGVVGTITVHPVEGNTVMEANVLWQKQIRARNIDAARAAMRPLLDAAKRQYAPASSDEQLKFKPV